MPNGRRILTNSQQNGSSSALLEENTENVFWQVINVIESYKIK